MNMSEKIIEICELTDNEKESLRKSFEGMFENTIIGYSDVLTNESIIEEIINNLLSEIGYPQFKNLQSIIIQKIKKEDVRKKIIYDIIIDYLSDIDAVVPLVELFDDDSIVVSCISKIIEVLKNEKENLENKNIDDTSIEQKDLKIFACIPLENEDTVLDNDLLGKNSTIQFYGNTFQVASPHGHKFKNGKSNNSKLAKLFLKYLNDIEENLKNSRLMDRCRKHGTFQFESNTAVMRDTNNKIRIQLHEIKNCVFIVGIYYKDAKGINGNNDLIVQKEYENRTKFLEQISKLPEEKFKEYIILCEKAYQKFKLVSRSFG